MAIPEAMLSDVQALDPATIEGVVAYDHMECDGAAFHSPRPLLLHELTLPSGRSVALCGNCMDNLTILSLIMEKHVNLPPWPVLRCFGNRLRALLIPKEADG